MIETINEMLSLSFINRAIIVGVLVSLCAALLGVSLVLKRYSNIGDGLSHVGFGVTTVAVRLRSDFDITNSNTYSCNSCNFITKGRK